MKKQNKNDKVDILIEFARQTRYTLNSGQIKTVERMKMCLEANNWDMDKATHQYDRYYVTQNEFTLKVIEKDIKNNSLKYSNYSYE